MNEHEKLNYKYGRSIKDRIQFLLKDIEEKEEEYSELLLFSAIYFETEGSTLNSEIDNETLNKNENALTEINKIFYNEYQLDIWHTYKNKILVIK